MFELYLITRLDGINTLLTVSIVVLLLAAAGLLLFATISYFDADSDTEISQSITFRRWGIRGILFVLILGVIKSFVPTTKEALIIFGVGGTIEYLQENPTSKELPDKVIKCIDKLLNEYLIEEPESQNTKDS
jgi:hypothetical protein